MASEILVGSVAVGIVPSAEGFNDKLRAQLVPSAGQIGEDMGKAISDGVLSSLGSPLSEWADKQQTEAPEQGEKVATSFADAFKAKLEEMLDDLPPAEIDAETTEATAKLDSLRTEIEDLHAAVGVDITDTDAVATLDELKVKMADLGAADIPIDANITAATAKIDELRVMADKPVIVPVVMDSKAVDADIAKTDTKMAAAGDVAGAGWGSRFGSSAGEGIESKLGSGGALGNIATAVMGPLGKSVAVVAAGLGLAAHVAADFQEGITRLNTAAGESEKNLPMVASGLKEIATATGTSLSQLTSGAFMVESAGFHGAQALDVMSAAAEGAKISGADLGTVGDALTTVMVDFKAPASQAATMMSGLNSIVSHGKTTLQDLASSMSKVLPTASALGISFSQVGGLMATMTGRGISAKMAATGLNTEMLALAAPNAAAAKAMDEAGLSAGQLKKYLADVGAGSTKAAANILGMSSGAQQVADTLQKHGLIAAMDEVNQMALTMGAKGSPAYIAALKAMSGGIKGLGVELNTTAFSMKTTDANTKAVADSMSGGVKSVSGWATAQKDMNVQLDRAKEGLVVMAVNIGTAVLPAVSSLLHGFADMLPYVEDVGKAIGAIVGPVVITFFTGLSTIFKAMTDGPMKYVTLGLIAIGAAILLLTSDIDLVVISFNILEAVMAINPFVAIGIALIILVGLIVKFHKQILDFGEGIFDAIQKPFEDAFNGVKAAVSDVISWMSSHWITMVIILTAITGPIGALIFLFIKFHDQIINAFEDAFKAIEPIVKPPLEWIADYFKIQFDIAEAIVHVAMTAITFVFSTAFDAIMVVVKVAFGLIEAIAKVFFDIFDGIFKAAMDAITGNWTGAWNAIKQAAAEVWNAIKAFFSGALSNFISLFTQDLNSIKSLWTSFWSAIESDAKTAWGVVENAFTTAFNWVKNIFTVSITWVKSAWTAFWTTLESTAKTAWTTVENGFTTFFTNIKSAFTTAVSAIGTIWNKVESVVKVPVQFVINDIYDPMASIFNKVSGFLGGPTLPIQKMAGGGVVPGYAPGVDNYPVLLSRGESVLVPELTRAIGPDRINALNNEYSGGRKSTFGHYGGGIGGFLSGVASDLGNATGITSLVHDIAGLGKRLVRGAVTEVAKPLINDLLKLVPTADDGWKTDVYDIPKIVAKDALNWILKQDAKYIPSGGGVGSGTGKEVAAYADTFSTGVGHPYVTGGQGPNGWDCSGFSAYVYEHFGYFPGDQKVRYGTSESQFADPRLQSSGAQPGALVFFDDGFYANPGHVGVVLNGQSYVGADSPGVGTTTASLLGNVGFRIPKGGFAVPGATLNRTQLSALWQANGGPGGNVGHIAGAIAMAESGGRAIKQSGEDAANTGWGYWQITPGNVADLVAKTNAELAVSLYDSRGFEPWTTYNKGTYLQFMANGGYAAPGWGVVGEQGFELVKFQGGEQVMSHPDSMDYLSSVPAANGYAGGTPMRMGGDGQGSRAQANVMKGMEQRLDQLIGVTGNVGSEVGSRIDRSGRLAGNRAMYTRRNH